MRTDWPEAVERVSSFLRGAGAEARIEEFDEATPTAEDAARVAGCRPEQIVKSLVFLCDGRAVVALVPGNRRADPAKVAEAVGAARARVAKPDEVETATGFRPGAVAPFPLPQVERVLAERLLLREPLVWVGAGSSRHLAVLDPHELLRLTRAEPMDVVQESTYDSPALEGESSSGTGANGKGS
jgi:prolyl-tRNA editing enzyme YbaK/EbsC (Cys-tRNA(Pro) deacylase)